MECFETNWWGLRLPEEALSTPTCSGLWPLMEDAPVEGGALGPLSSVKQGSGRAELCLGWDLPGCCQMQV